MKFSVRTLTQMAMLIAVQVVLSRFCSIPTAITKIGFGFVPIALAGLTMGWLPAAMVGALSDILGALLFPTGAYFPGFTLTALLTGVVYGIFLYKRPSSWPRIILAVLTICVGFTLGLNTLWLMMITGKAYMALFPARIAQSAIMIPVQIIVLRLVTDRRVYMQLAPQP